MEHDQKDRVYSNCGNPALIDLAGKDCRRVLDVGCGAGDNAALLKSKYLECEVFGITHSLTEAEIAKSRMAHCWVFDVEQELPKALFENSFDTLIFSHVLEHLRHPAAVLSHFCPLLHKGGQVLIAIPNVLFWRMRLKFLLGNFEYDSTGVLDDTHLRFFTFFTAERYLLSQSPELERVYSGTTGSVPLWWLRRYVLPTTWSERIDGWACRVWPNFFGGQILIKAIKK